MAAAPSPTSSDQTKGMPSCPRSKASRYTSKATTTIVAAMIAVNRIARFVSEPVFFMR